MGATCISQGAYEKYTHNCSRDVSSWETARANYAWMGRY